MIDRSMFRTEYLVIVDRGNGVGTTVDGLRHLLNAHESISLDKDELKYENTSFVFSVTNGKVATSSEDPFFHLIFECADEEELISFAKALKAVREVLARFTTRPAQTLWDGIGFHYANLAYPLIHRIENLMRMLITKFMFITIGSGWTKTNVPAEVRESIRGNGSPGDHNYLFSLDFIQLANFLFKPYASSGQEELIRYVEDATNKGNAIEIGDLEKYIPKSNWARYFEAVVDCDADYLNKRWTGLYTLRCKIAHNNIVNLADYEKITRLVSELEEKLEAAIGQISKVEVSEEERETIAEDVAGLHTAYGEFIARWKQLERLAYSLAADVMGSEGYEQTNPPQPIYRMIDVVAREGYISEKLYRQFNELRQLRNTIVHEPYSRLSSPEIESAIREMEDISFQMKEQVYKAFDTRAERKQVNNNDEEDE